MVACIVSRSSIVSVSLAAALIFPVIGLPGAASLAAPAGLSEVEMERLQNRVTEASKVGDWGAVRRALGERPDLLYRCVRASGQMGDSTCPVQGGVRGVRIASAVLINAAASNGDGSLLPMLLTSGANINARSSDGVPALLLAQGAGNDSMVSALLASGVDANQPGPDGMTALHVAVTRGDTAMADRLLAAGARPAPDARGHMPGYYLFWQNNGDPALAAFAQRLGYGEAHEYVARQQAREQSRADMAQFAQAMLQAMGSAVAQPQIQAPQQPGSQPAVAQNDWRADPFAVSTQGRPQSSPSAAQPMVDYEMRETIVAENGAASDSGGRQLEGLCFQRGHSVIRDYYTTRFVDENSAFAYVCYMQTSGPSRAVPFPEVYFERRAGADIQIIICGRTFYVSLEALNKSARSYTQYSFDGWRDLRFVVAQDTYDEISVNGQNVSVQKHIVSCPTTRGGVDFLMTRGGR